MFNVGYKATNANDYEEVREKLKNRQEIQKMYFDKRARTLPDFGVGNRVRIQDERSKAFERRGIIVNKPERPRSYDILTESGTVLNRNRKHIIGDSANSQFNTV